MIDTRKDYIHLEIDLQHFSFVGAISFSLQVGFLFVFVRISVMITVILSTRIRKNNLAHENMHIFVYNL
jgi:hypothetical protein